MARLVKKTLTFQGRQEAGLCECPCCHTAAKVLPYKEGELWTTLLCPLCGWYQVPTMNANRYTEFAVVVMELHERNRSAKK